MLEIPDVTLVCVFTICHDLHLMAINDCLERVKFGDVKIFSDRTIYPETDIIGPFDNESQFADFAQNRLPFEIKTSHALFIQWDSWVIDPQMWRSEYLDYDYIGAPWWYSDGRNVGNSGFCLRSTSLMRFLAQNRDKFPIGTPEDHILCREYQKNLPQFKWAPVKVAQDF